VATFIHPPTRWWRTRNGGTRGHPPSAQKTEHSAAEHSGLGWSHTSHLYTHGTGGRARLEYKSQHQPKAVSSVKVSPTNCRPLVPRHEPCSSVLFTTLEAVHVNETGVGIAETRARRASARVAPAVVLQYDKVTGLFCSATPCGGACCEACKGGNHTCCCSDGDAVVDAVSGGGNDSAVTRHAGQPYWKSSRASERASAFGDERVRVCLAGPDGFSQKRVDGEQSEPRPRDVSGGFPGVRAPPSPCGSTGRRATPCASVAQPFFSSSHKHTCVRAHT
jgi:hypothetical protein